MKNEHKKSRDYLNMAIPLWKLAKPKTKGEKTRYAQRIDRELEKEYQEDYPYQPDEIYYNDMTAKERREDDKKSHDYLNWRIPFNVSSGWFGRPRTKEETALFCVRRDEEFGDCEGADWIEEDDDIEDHRPVKVWDKKGNLLTDLDDPFDKKAKGHRYYLDMEHPLSFDYFDVPSDVEELELYNRRVDLDPSLTEEDKLVGVIWDSPPEMVYNEEIGEFQVFPSREAGDKRIEDNQNLPHMETKLIGIGACGNRVVNLIVQSGLEDVESAAMDTDKSILDTSEATRRRWLRAEEETPMTEEQMAKKSKWHIIDDILRGAETVILALSLGDKAGSGAAPVIASFAKERGASVIAAALLPYSFDEKSANTETIEAGWARLQDETDATLGIVLLSPSEKGTKTESADASIWDLYRLRDDEALRKGMISDMPLLTGLSEDKEWTRNEFIQASEKLLAHSVQTILPFIKTQAAEREAEIYETYVKPVSALHLEATLASMGIGEGVGENAVVSATNLALASPFLWTDSLAKAQAVLLRIEGSDHNLSSGKIESARAIISEAARDNTEIHCLTAKDDSMGEAVRVTVIAFVEDEWKTMLRRNAEKEAVKREKRREKLRARNILRIFQRFGSSDLE